MASSLPPAIFLMGPTASGKTEAAISLCDALPCDVISVDSTQVYRGLDIGSAKPAKQELEQTPHRLIDICEPNQPYSAADFREDALREMKKITASGRVPLLVGGTMLYFKALRDGLAELPETDDDVRAEVLAEAEKEGWPAMHEKLRKVDPLTADRLHPNHSQRIGRALEVYRMTGEPLSSWHARQQPAPLPYRLLQLALIPQDRQWLYSRIDQRFEQMMKSGFLQEVESLYNRGDIHGDLPAIRSVGYRQVWQYLQQRESGTDLGECLTRDKMIERAKIASRQLAKRQLTWLRSWPDLQTVAIGPASEGSGDSQSDSVVGVKCLQVVNAFLYPDPPA